ncbi:unnamed protein product, partial [Rotaria magnacalcarata]
YYERTGDSLNSDDDATVVDIRQQFDNNSTVTPTNPMDLQWSHTNGTNLSSSSSSTTTSMPSQMMYTSNNQNTNFSTPFQPHPSPHFNT